MKIKKQQALDYHSRGRKGKIEVVASKPCRTQLDLSLAYTPGVAEPCLEIEKNPELAYEYTAKGNLVAVVSNGTAVLGLGDIGALAGKPVMEGKGVLFKRFADIDVFDIEVNSHDPDEVIKVVQLLEPTFGGINLEDIKAPECFYIEETLKKTTNIPVFHDDQHGTAIISGAALLNALEIVGKDIGDVKVVFNGAGASGIACALHYASLGVKLENVILCDSRGVVYKGREKGMNKYKEIFAADTDRRTLEEAMRDADVFTGCSIGNVVTQDMVRSMAKDPIIFAMANPTPEISYEEAIAARSDIVMATGRSDYPNQVNNVLGFPFIFRGALDVRATTINEEMKIAATQALAKLAREDVPEAVLRAYDATSLHFGREYIIPKPFDPRVLLWEASAVAKAAMDSGVARRPVDIDKYQDDLERRLGKSRQVMRIMIHKAQEKIKRIVYPEGEDETILRAVHMIKEEEIAEPVLIGDPDVIKQKIKDLDLLHSYDFEIIDPKSHVYYDSYVQELYKLRQRKGFTLRDAERMMRRRPNYLGAMMLHMGHVDGMISGISGHYPDTIKPALQILGSSKEVEAVAGRASGVAGVYVLFARDRTYFFADTTVNIEPNEFTLAAIAIQTADVAKWFNVEPRVAMLSFSNFGSVKHASTDKVKKAVQIVRQQRPDLMIDGEMQANFAMDGELREKIFGFSDLKGEANVLIFPDLQSGNIAYKLMMTIGGAKAIGPILMGMKKPVHVLQHGCDTDDVVNMTAIACVDIIEND